jgi:chromosome segregation ATPase
MAEKPPRRPGSLGAFAGRRSPARGVPIFESEPDDDLTPPPQPIPTEVEGYSVEDQIRVLRASANEQAEAIERVWAARDLNDQVKGMSTDVTEMTALMREFLMPAVKQMLGRMDRLEQAHAADSARAARFDNEWATAIRTIESIGQHVARVEKDVDRLERTVDTSIKRGDEQGAQVRQSLEELKNKDGVQEVRIRALEDFVLTVKAKVAIVGTLMGGGGAGVVVAIQHFFG